MVDLQTFVHQQVEFGGQNCANQRNFVGISVAATAVEVPAMFALLVENLAYRWREWRERRRGVYVDTHPSAWWAGE